MEPPTVSAAGAVRSTKCIASSGQGLGQRYACLAEGHGVHVQLPLQAAMHEGEEEGVRRRQADGFGDGGCCGRDTSQGHTRGSRYVQAVQIQAPVSSQGRYVWVDGACGRLTLFNSAVHLWWWWFGGGGGGA